MREFILRARKGPSTPDFSLDEIGGYRHLEIIAHCIVNALFCSRRIRPDTALHLVLEGGTAPPKIVRMESDALGSLEGLDERSIWKALRQALEAGRKLTLGEETDAAPGIFVAKKSFEQLVREKVERGPLYYLKRGGEDIRSIRFTAPVCFLFTDHLTMPKKSDRFLERLGALPVSVGPHMLFASHCVVLVHNELDRQGVE